MPRRRPLRPLHRLMRLTRPLRYALMIPTLETLRVLAGRLSHAGALGVGNWAGGIAGRLSIRGRRIAREQLERTGMGSDAAERRRICGTVFRQLGMNAMEWLNSLHWTEDEIRERIDMEELLPRVQEALAGGRGLIFVSAHMGNWELLPRAYHVYTGRQFAAVMAENNDQAMTQWLVRVREAEGASKLLPMSESLAIVRHLRQGGALALLADQDSTRSRGIFVDFFGRPAYTPVGPAHLARRFGAPLLPAAIVRDPAAPARHRVLVGQFIRHNPALEEEADLARMTQEYTRVFEGWVRQFPGQWVWIHERWRHRPGQKIRVRGARRRD